MQDKAKRQAYWTKNLLYITGLLSIWFAVSYLCGILVADPLDVISLGGFKLGFWFANQGSELIFIILIFVYAWLMNDLDKKYGVYED